MAPYRYNKLDQAKQEIRLIKLRPGAFSSKLRASITHEPFIIPQDVVPKVLSKEELQKTLPTGWTVWETLEGRFLFCKVREDGTATTWTHPIPDFPESQYNPQRPQSQIQFQPKYEALSYTWGSPDKSESLFVEETSSTTPPPEDVTILISPNLGLALRHLRDAKSARILWVDAICINQDDINERNDQVRRMGDIYQSANRVVVWLGPKAENSSLAVRTLNYLGKEIEFTRDRFFLPSPHCKEKAWYSSRTKLPYDDQILNGIYDLLGRPWFQRLWVFQEVQLANSHAVMQCGDDIILWYHFRRAILRLGSQMHLYSSLFQTLLLSIASISERRLNTTLPRLLGTATILKCSEPRDKVYAILGMTTPALSNCIVPQYGLPIGEVYKQAFLAYTKLSHRLELLVRASFKTKLPQSPSWVPNYSTSDTISLVYAIGYRATGVSQAQINYVAPDVLEVTGIPIGVVRKLGRSNFKVWDHVFQVVRDVGPDSLQTGVYPTGETQLDAYAWTLSSGLLSDRIQQTSYYISLKAWKQRLLTTASSMTGADTIPPDRLPNLILEALKDRQMIETVDGYIGMRQREFYQEMKFVFSWVITCLLFPESLETANITFSASAIFMASWMGKGFLVLYPVHGKPYSTEM